MFKDNLPYYINKMRLRSNYNYVSSNEIAYDFFEEERNAVYISRLHLDALDICGDYRSNIKKILKSKTTYYHTKGTLKNIVKYLCLLNKRQNGTYSLFSFYLLMFVLNTTSGRALLGDYPKAGDVMYKKLEEFIVDNDNIKNPLRAKDLLSIKHMLFPEKFNA